MRSAALCVALAVLAGCTPQEAPRPVASIAPAAPESSHTHPTSYPPVGASVKVGFDGKTKDIDLAPLAAGGWVPVLEVVKRAFPDADLASLHFDFTGSDGFHPSARPKCRKPLGLAEVKAARMEASSHDLKLDDALELPHCYGVHAVVAIDLSR